MSSSVYRALSGILVGMILVAGSAIASPPVSIGLSEQGVEATREDGLVVWRSEQWMGTSAQLGLSATGAAHAIPADSSILDGIGRPIEGRAQRPAAKGPGAPLSSEWERPVMISGDEQDYQTATGPMIQSSGDVVVVSVGLSAEDFVTTFVLEQARWNAATETWSAPETVYSTTDQILAMVGRIDSQDRISVVFRVISGVSNRLQSMRYTPELGWSGPRTIYSTTSFFQQVDLAVDEVGNAVAVLEEDTDSGSNVLAFTFDAASEEWGGPEVVSVPGAERTSYPTLVQD
ncbi:MAG: hypothetical protein AAGA68_22730 [Pseudomonadota bacterium]